MSYQIRVHEDGDTEIRQTGIVRSKFCCEEYLEFDSVTGLKDELKEYGHDEDRIMEAIDTMLIDHSNEWIKV